MSFESLARLLLVGVTLDFHLALVGLWPRLALLLTLFAVQCLLPPWPARSLRLFSGAAMLSPLMAWGGAMICVHALLAMGILTGLRRSLEGRIQGRSEREKERLAHGILLGAHGLALLVLLQGTVIHDAQQYSMPLRSLLVQGDLDLYDELYLHNSQRFYNPHARSCRYVGTALVEAPAVAFAHGLELLRGKVSPSGFEEAHRMAVAFVSSTVGFLGIFLAFRLARRFAGRRSALLATLSLWGGSEVLFFQYQWVGWPHPLSWTAVAAFLLLWVDTRQGRSFPVSLLLGALGGWAILIRPVNALFFSLPLLFDEGGFRRHLRPKGLAGLLALILPLPAILSLQSAVWWKAVGRVFASPYGEVGDLFRVWSPALLGSLFSPEHHGWFFWTPLALLSLLGLVAFTRRWPAMGAAFFFVILLEIWALASWSVWWTGVGFGNRFFLNLSPLLILGLASMHGRLRGRSRQLLEGLCVLLVVWNLHLLAAYRSEAIPMGILPPIEVRDLRPTATSILGGVWSRGPEALLSVWRSSWMQRNCFLEPIGLGLLHRDPTAARRGLLWLVFLGLSAAALHALGRLVEEGRRGAARNVAAVLVGVPLIAGGLILSFARGGREQDRPWKLVADDWLLVEDEALRLTAPRGMTVDRLDLIAFCLGVDPRPGELVATVRVHERGGGLLVFPLRGGIDLAEADRLRPDLKPVVACGIADGRIAHRRPTGRLSTMPYESQAYHRRIDLPRPIALEAVEIRRAPSPRGRLVVTDCFARRP